MFISEYHLIQFKQSSHIYRDFPMALIFYRELLRKEILKKKDFHLELVKNYYHKFDDGFIEILFPDFSVLILKFNDGVAHVYHPQTFYFKQFDLP